jgi:hypothetical protein
MSITECCSVLAAFWLLKFNPRTLETWGGSDGRFWRSQEWQRRSG